MFPPRPERRRDQGARSRACELELDLVLALPPVTLGGKDRADHGAARPLDHREPVACAEAAGERQRTQHEMAEKDLHEQPVRRKSSGKRKTREKLLDDGAHTREGKIRYSPSIDPTAVTEF